MNETEPFGQKKQLSFNPFKMWGSYVGVVVGLVGSYLSFALVLDAAEKGLFTMPVLLIPFAPAIIGFLGGWGMHVVFRKILFQKRENNKKVEEQ